MRTSVCNLHTACCCDGMLLVHHPATSKYTESHAAGTLLQCAECACCRQATDIITHPCRPTYPAHPPAIVSISSRTASSAASMAAWAMQSACLYASSAPASLACRVEICEGAGRMTVGA